ncbi:MAG: hypothetical protein AUI95_02785 [Crenarchaeota archaeon 13_1_40CM_3_52_4]|nr:MAG: hypothetical protein AUI95_02785 [Crenarchaeota archaeon 13_1_40CM_3_52_4]
MDQETGRVSKTAWAPEIDVRIANPPPALLKKYTLKEKAFFYDYASFVVRLIRNEEVTDRIRGVISAERILIDRPVDIRVMVFPARTFRGRQNRVLHGSYSESASQISLYPLRIPREWIRGEGIDLFRAGCEGLSQRKLRLLYEMSEIAVSTMIHEILHVKFQRRSMSRYGEEALVQELERQFMQGWEEWIRVPVQHAISVIS